MKIAIEFKNLEAKEWYVKRLIEYFKVDAENSYPLTIWVYGIEKISGDNKKIRIDDKNYKSIYVYYNDIKYYEIHKGE